MRKFVFLFSINLLMILNSYSQLENNNWYFGKKAAISFNNLTSNPPTPIYTSEMDQQEGSASISDSKGNLLFYTDGVSVWNKNNTIMPNGNNLLGHCSSGQNVVIVPFPGYLSKYYIFTAYVGQGIIPPWVNHSPYNFSVVDMDLDNGLGDIISNQKNLPLLNQNSQILIQNSSSNEGLTVLKSSTEESYWLLIPVANSTNKLFAYKIDNSGLLNIPTISNLSYPTSLSQNLRIKGDSFPSNRIAISPYFGSLNNFKILSFNRFSGILEGTLFEFINYPYPIYSVEFKNELLYFNTYNGFYVIDMRTGNARLVWGEQNSTTYTGSIQTAINNEIYLTKPFLNSQNNITNDINSVCSISGTTSQYIYKIQNSDSYSNCYVSTNPQDNVYLGNFKQSLLGLPQLIETLPTNTCLPNRDLSNFIQDNNITFNASQNITARDNYKITGDVVFNSANNILLKSGSSVSDGGIFLGKIQNCTNTANKTNVNENVGKSEIKKTVKIYYENLPIDFKAYPNPSKDIFRLSTQEDVEIFNLTLIDINEREIKTIDCNNQSSIDINISDFENGIYFVKINSNRGIYTKKIIKN